MGNSFQERRVGRETTRSLLHFSHRSHLSISTAPHSYRVGSQQESETPASVGATMEDRKWGQKALPFGWGATFPSVLTQPNQTPFSFASHVSTPKAAKNSLTQLAMEHSPKTLPISKTSQKLQTPTKWRQRSSCLFQVIYDLRATSGAEFTPPLSLRHVPCGLGWVESG